LIHQYKIATDKEHWEEFLSKFENSSIYYSPDWFELLETTFGISGQHLFYKQDKKINGCLPLFLIKNPILGKKLISTPHGSCGGGALTNDQEIESELIEKAIDFCKDQNIGYLEIRSDAVNPVLKKKGFIHRQPFVRNLLRLEDESSNFKKLTKGHKAAINTKNELKVHQLANLDELKIWYDIYQETNRNFGTPAYGFNFFKNIYYNLIDKGLANLLLSKVGNKIVGGILLLKFKKTVIYRLGAVNKKYLQLRPYNKLLWEGIKYSLNNNCKYFDMGTSAIENNGLIKFKKHFGTDTLPVNFYYFKNKMNIPKMERYLSKDMITKKIWKKLPVFFTEKLGVPIRKWIC